LNVTELDEHNESYSHTKNFLSRDKLQDSTFQPHSYSASIIVPHIELPFNLTTKAVLNNKKNLILVPIERFSVVLRHANLCSNHLNNNLFKKKE